MSSLHHSDAVLREHLDSWLGLWPGATKGVEIVGAPQRDMPGWDGRIHPVIGVCSPDCAVVSVPPDTAPAMLETAEPGTAWDDLLIRVPALLNRPERRLYSGIFRWCDRPTSLPDAGVWVDPAQATLPDWLHPFQQVLVAWDLETGNYLAGVGLKHHDDYGREIAVGTAPEAQGRGLARRLVAQAARRVLDEGGVPTYQHHPSNIASERVAVAAGFPDRGWRSAAVA